MQYLDYLEGILKDIKTQKLRTVITFIIIAIGIMALVSNLTVVEALNKTFTGNFKALGANTFTIQRYANQIVKRRKHGSRWKKAVNPPLLLREAKVFKKSYRFPGTKTTVFHTVDVNVKLKNGSSETKMTEIKAVDENFARVNSFEIAEGRNFTVEEAAKAVPLAVIGPQVKKALFGNKEAMGKNFIYKGRKFRIIGVTKEKGAVFGASEDNFAWITLKTAGELSSASNPQSVRIKIAVDNPEKFDEAMDKAIALMRQIRKLKPGQENNFGIRSSRDALEELKKTEHVLRMMAFIIGLITILASAIALMNIMLVNVTEKFREIGIRKAVGASNQSILLRFLAETVLIGILGSIPGIILGVLTGWGVAALLKARFVMPWNAVLWAIFITFVTAIVSGIYPAIKAAKANPVEVLRYE